MPYFDGYITLDDDIRLQQNLVQIEGVRVELNQQYDQQVIDKLKPNSNSVVIYPTFTSAAYKLSLIHI